MDLIYKNVEDFLTSYSEQILENALKIRSMIFETLPSIQEQVDMPAKMIAYCYGQKYSELICVLIPSKKGLKLSFNQGCILPDPANILEGNGKITRYVEIKTDNLDLDAIKQLLLEAYKAYQKRILKV